jgi:transposase
MAKAYSDDLRRKLLEAHDSGEGTLEELAERFRVSVGWAVKISAARRKTGKMERQPGAKRGRVSKVTEEIRSFLNEAVKSQPDATLAELQVRLWEERHLEIGIGWLWQVLKRMGLRYKKNAARHRAGRREGETAARKLAVPNRRVRR